MKPMGTSPRADDRVASYSAKGPALLDRTVKAGIVAPGNRIVSLRAWEGAMWDGYTGNRVGTEKYLLSGTRMAAPMVGGAERHRTLSPKAVRNPATNEVSLVFANGVVWGTSLVWGNGKVTGESVNVAINGEN